MVIKENHKFALVMDLELVSALLNLLQEHLQLTKLILETPQDIQDIPQHSRLQAIAKIGSILTDKSSTKCQLESKEELLHPQAVD